MNILIIRLSALGDVAMTIPAVYSVARSYSHHHFWVLTTSFFSKLFINAPKNISIIAVNPKRIHGIMGTFRLIWMLRHYSFSLVADLHNVLRSWLIDGFFYARGSNVAMLNKDRRERLQILRNEKKASRPFVQRYFDVFARLGLPVEEKFSSLFEGGAPVLPSTLPQKSTMRWVGVAPFARYMTKIYPMDKMREVVRLLCAKENQTVFLFGARGAEAEELERWVKDFPNVISVAGKMTLEEELALMAHLDVMLTMDSANMHLASLVGTRVVSIWGSTTPACGFMGFGQKGEDALVSGLSCQPCSIAGSKRCRMGSLACMMSLKSSELLKYL